MLAVFEGMQSLVGVIASLFLTGGGAAFDPFDPGDPYHMGDKKGKAKDIAKAVMAQMQKKFLPHLVHMINAVSANAVVTHQLAFASQWVIRRYVPFVYTRLSRELNSNYNQLAQRTELDYQNSLRAVRSSATAVNARSDRLFASAVRTARQLVAGANSYTRSQVAASAARLRDQISALRTTVNRNNTDLLARLRVLRADMHTTVHQNLVWAEHYTDVKVAAATKVVDNNTTKVVAAAQAKQEHDLVAAIGPGWDLLAQSVTDLRAELAHDLPDITRELDHVHVGRPGTDAAAMASLVAGVTTAMRYMQKCGVPNCKNLSKVGRDLGNLFHALEGAAFLALLAEMIHDPHGMAREVTSVVGPIMDATAGTLRSALDV